MNTQNGPEYLVVTGSIKPKKVEKFEEAVQKVKAEKRINAKISFIHTSQSNITEAQMKERVWGKQFSKIVFHECSCGMIQRICSCVTTHPNKKMPFMVMIPKDHKEKSTSTNIRVVNEIHEAFDFIH